jgi:formamidase
VHARGVSRMNDLQAGRYRLPWEDTVRVTDCTSCGVTAPTRLYGKPVPKAAE